MGKTEKIIKYLKENLENQSLSQLNRVIENKLLGFNINPDFNTAIIAALPELRQPKVSILQIAPCTGVLTQQLIKKYQNNTFFIDVTLLFNSENELKICKMIMDKFFPKSSSLLIRYVVADYLEYTPNMHYDILISAPTNKKVTGIERLKLARRFNDNKSNNLTSFIIQKALKEANNIGFVLPKYFLHNMDFSICRDRVAQHEINYILDFAELAFEGISAESIGLFVNTQRKPSETRVNSFSKRTRITQRQMDITNPLFPTWVVYTNDFFKAIAIRMDFNIFDAFRDRQITNEILKPEGKIPVLKAKNIPRDGSGIIKTKDDVFVTLEDAKTLNAAKYLDRDDVYLCPNLTNHPRVVKKPAGYIASGSLAVLIPKKGVSLSQDDLAYFASEEFERFYQIARNYSTRSLNIDKNAIFYFGKLLEH